MNTSSAISGKFDLVKWILVAVLIAGGIGEFYYFSEYLLFLRVAGLLALFGAAVFVASKTQKGHLTVGFIKETHLEVRKVVWPTRQETVQMTSIVLLMVLLVALIIWFLDSILMWLVRLLTG
jgi:preprotein translocase subunit SecE